MERELPGQMKRIIARKHLKFFNVDAVKVAAEVGLGNRINMVTQTAFFKLSNVLPLDDAIAYIKDAIRKTYGKKGEDVVNKNYAAVDRGGEYKELAVDPAWATLEADAAPANNDPAFINEVVRPINAQDGDLLKVSAFKGIEDGTWPQGTAAYEKRGVAAFVPTWNPDNCIQCNKCAYVCPHAAIRPFVLDAEEMKGFNAPVIEMKAPAAMKGMNFRIQVSVMDCLGCGNCADVCPGNPKLGKALTMVPLEQELDEAPNWEYCVKNVKSKQDLVDIKSNVKNFAVRTAVVRVLRCMFWLR